MQSFQNEASQAEPTPATKESGSPTRRECLLLAGSFLLNQAAVGADRLADAQPPGLREDRIALITDWLRDDVAKGVVPGAVLLIAHRGVQVCLQALGSLNPASEGAMVSDAIFRIESMTKPVTTAAAMTLVDEGKLKLDDSIGAYLPVFANPKIGYERSGSPTPFEIAPATRPITVRDLMRHTAGLDYGWLAPKSERTRLLNASARNYRRDFDSTELVNWLASAPLAAEPGTVWNYSSGMDVLGHLVEIVSGKSLGTFMKSRIFDPLGMADTDFFVTTADSVNRVAEPVANERAGMSDPRVIRRLESGGQGLTSTAPDYARFLQMLLDGGESRGKRVLSKESVAQMTSDQLGSAISRGTGYAPGEAYGFGLGFAVRTKGRGASPPGELGDYWWGGGTGTYCWVDPMNQLVVVLMMQSRKQRLPYRTMLREMVYDAVIR